MRGRGQAGHKKKSSRAPAETAQPFDEKPVNESIANNNKSKGAQKDESAYRTKSKKKGKNWRFAYDLYCKELISSNAAQPQSHRSIEKSET